MTWTKLSDDYTDDTWALSDEAFRLHTEGLVWSNRKLLDLRLPKADVRRFSKHPEAVAELLAGDWWTEDGDAYVIQHHARYQRMRDAVIRQQTVNKENRAKRGQETKPSREVMFNESSNESLNESKNDSTVRNDSSHEMDGSGQAGMKKQLSSEISVDRGTGEVLGVPASTVTTWDVAPIGRSCVVCGTSMAGYPDSMKVCASQDDEHTKYRTQNGWAA